MMNKGSNGCKSQPVFSLSQFSSRDAPSHTLNGGDFAQMTPFIPFLTSNQSRTTWCVEADGVCSGALMLKKGSNGCKSRPVFSLFPFSSQAAPGHCRNAGDFDPNRHFHPFLTANRSRTTWCVQTHGVCSGPVRLKKVSNGCKSQPVFSLFRVSSRISLSHTPYDGDFVRIAPFIPYLDPKSA